MWEFGGLWDFSVWQRQPHIKPLNLGIIDKQEIFWLYQVEDAVLMVEVKPTTPTQDQTKPFGQVLLRRLISADQVIERLTVVEEVINRSYQS